MAVTTLTDYGKNGRSLIHSEGGISLPLRFYTHYLVPKNSSKSLAGNLSPMAKEPERKAGLSSIPRTDV
jgi:hypothetical protein